MESLIRGPAPGLGQPSGAEPPEKGGSPAGLHVTALIMQTGKELQEFVGTGVRVALCPLCISILCVSFSSSLFASVPI